MNIAAALHRVNRIWLVVGALVVLISTCKLALTLGVELGKDEAVYWYWSRNWDLTYAPLVFALLRLADTLSPGTEWALRACQVSTGVISMALMFHWCRVNGLSESRSLWAMVAFATSHWIWHSSSYLHPDGFLVSAWLLVLVLARRALTTEWTPIQSVGVGVATAIPAYCKYSGAVLAAAVYVWLYLACSQSTVRRRVTTYGLLAFIACVSPLAVTHYADAFQLPQALSSLSRIAGEASILSRFGLFLVAPLLFVSPFLLWGLYRALVSGAAVAVRTFPKTRPTARAEWIRDHAQLLLALIPASTILLCFGFFALYRGQVKGNWILPGLVGLWPFLFGACTRLWSQPASRGFLATIVVIGALQTAAIGIALKYPGAADSAMRTLGIQQVLDESYPRLVSRPDQAREPTRSWNERLCEYAGWRAFTGRLERTISEAGLPPTVSLVSTQYNLPFTTAYYAAAGSERIVYTVADPRFRRLADLDTETADVDSLLFVARSGSQLPHKLADAFSPQTALPPIRRSAPGCDPVEYEMTLLIRHEAPP